MNRFPLLLLLSTLLALAGPAAAQQSVRLRGQVIDEQTGEPVPGVHITARAANDRYLRSVLSDDDGRFELIINRVNAVWLYASRIGYRNNRTPTLYFDGNEYFEVEVRLDPEAILLAPLEVVARSDVKRSPVLSGFDQRVRHGNGYYLTRRDIEALRPNQVSDLLATIPGVRLGSSGSGTRRTVRMARTEGQCPVQIFVDGLLVTRRLLTAAGPRVEGVIVDDVVSPNSVEGIEVYRGLSTVPAEFLTQDARCGVIAIWTRRGG